MKKWMSHVVVFLITVAVLGGLLVLAAMIPRTAIEKNVKKSAQYLCEKPVFFEVAEGVESTMIDRYADAILLGIAYQYDSDKPLESVMWSSYYHTDMKNENDNLLEAVEGKKEANMQYLRYWHGSNTLVRPLLTVLPVKGIYVLNAFVLLALFVWLLTMLARKRCFVPMVGLLAGVVFTQSWFVPMSLEYTWTYLIMLITSIVALTSMRRNGWKYISAIFLVTGMVTSYMDFLTTETLTLLIPLLLLLSVEHTDTPWKKSLQMTLYWGVGYAGMWLIKWGIASLVLQQNVMPYVAKNVSERIGGEINLGIGEYLWGAVANNVSCLFPIDYGMMGACVMIVILLVIAYLLFVYRKKNIDKTMIILFAVFGMVPYVRYLVLHNHAYLHCFFTYRAQMVTVFALAWIVGHVTEWRWLIRANTRRR